MVGDVGELVVEQPRVDGVEDPAHADRAVPGGEVAAWFIASVATRSPGLMPSRFERLRHAPRVVRDVAPSWCG